METEEPPKAVEVTSGIQPVKHHILQNPRKKAVPGDSPGVLQLGKILAEKAVEVEAVRILVPKAAITHDIPNKNAKVKSLGHHRGEFLGQSEGVGEPRKELSEVKNVLEKLKNSERRLLQDKEGLSNQLRVQTEVRTNRLNEHCSLHLDLLSLRTRRLYFLLECHLFWLVISLKSFLLNFSFSARLVERVCVANFYPKPG